MRIYTPVWHKYRPVILKMMIDAGEQPASYQLSAHEFRALSRQKGGFTFSLSLSNGKAVGGLRDSVIAQDLWQILQSSPKANELISHSNFQLTMDKDFVLHVNKHQDQVQ